MKDDKNSFVNTYFISIINGQESKITNLIKLTTHLDLSRSTRYNLFSEYNSIRENLSNKKYYINR